MAGARAQRERDSKKTLKGQHHAWRPRAQRIGELTSACVRGLEGARVSQLSHPSRHKICMGGWVGHGWHPRADRVGELTFACVGGFEGRPNLEP